MDSRRAPRKLTLAKYRELEVAAAVAQEEIMQFHVASALGLIELAAGRVSAVRVVAIYTRLHGISGAMARLVSTSVLAALGHRAARGTAASLVVEGEESVAHDPFAFLRLLRIRLRGRVLHDLRRTVELAFGTAQVGLLDLHVQHAVRFARELAETHDTAEAIDLYSSMTGVTQPTRDVLYTHVLDRVAAEELPARNGRRARVRVVSSRRRRSRVPQRAVA